MFLLASAKLSAFLVNVQFDGKVSKLFTWVIISSGGLVILYASNLPMATEAEIKVLMLGSDSTLQSFVYLSIF